MDTFRASYNYSNSPGYTAGAKAVADAMKMNWADLADEILFRPLEMTDSSYRHADYQKAPNRALIHVPAGNRTWAAKYSRDADPEAPAGGASSSVRDLARWLRLQLANGSYDGRRSTQRLSVSRMYPTLFPGGRRPRQPAPGFTGWDGMFPTTTRRG